MAVDTHITHIIRALLSNLVVQVPLSDEGESTGDIRTRHLGFLNHHSFLSLQVLSVGLDGQDRNNVHDERLVSF